VNNSQHPLRLNVGHLYNKSIGTSHAIPVDFDCINIEDLAVKDLLSLVRLSRTREGLLLQVNIEAKILTTCVRCLKEFYITVEAAFDELYEFPSRYREETDLILPDDGYIDLSALYREYLILAIPIKSICTPDCNGLCPVCGANLNEMTCEHRTEAGTHEEDMRTETTG
jgi:uncharacterized protein